MRERLLILPVFNEEDYIIEVLESLPKDVDILVIDDGSTDNTLKILEQAKIDFLIQHKTNQGYGKSLIDGFECAIKNNYTYIVTMDCDAQHEPEYIPTFFEELKNFDIVSGSRYLPTSPHFSKPPKDRVEINKFITQLICKYTNYNITDAFCGFKGYRAEALKKLHLTEHGYGMPLQLWIQASKANLSLKEIPVPLIYHTQNRNFKGSFKSKDERLKYYLEVIKKEL
jgi:dolichol-phosphate mannosyltransferase